MHFALHLFAFSLAFLFRFILFRYLQATTTTTTAAGKNSNTHIHTHTLRLVHPSHSHSPFCSCTAQFCFHAKRLKTFHLLLSRMSKQRDSSSSSEQGEEQTLFCVRVTARARALGEMRESRTEPRRAEPRRGKDNRQ